MTYKNILEDVLNEIKPSKNEVKTITKEINYFIKQIKCKDTKIVLGGSMAKGTWLKDKYDADIFVQFNYNKFKDKDISKELEKKLKNFKIIKLHGSRDYFQIENNITYEIVPTLNIKKSEDALNITDVSPLHSKWVKKYSNDKLKDEIRLTKQFFKANKLYGAESYIKGFSGYVLEILTIYYGSFIKLLKAVSKYKENEVVDISKHHKDVFFEVNSSKLTSPIVVIDPVQKGRNAAAALSEDKFNELIKISKKFLDKPSKEFFTEKKLDLNKLLNKKNTLVLDITPQEGKGDVVGCKIEKAFKFFERMLQRNDFEIINSNWEWDEKVIVYFTLKDIKLSKNKIIIGPNEKFTKGVEQFKKKYSNAKLVKGNYQAETERTILNAKDYIKTILKDKFIKERVKGAKLLC